MEWRLTRGCVWVDRVWVWDELVGGWVGECKVHVSVVYMFMYVYI